MDELLMPSSPHQSILFTLLTFSTYSLLVSISIKQILRKEIRIFLWQGGKAKSNKQHFINLNTMQDAVKRGWLVI